MAKKSEGLDLDEVMRRLDVAVDVLEMMLACAEEGMGLDTWRETFGRAVDSAHFVGRRLREIRDGGSVAPRVWN